jgi:hypothetical protein
VEEATDQRQVTVGSAGEGRPDRQPLRESHPPQPQGPRRCPQRGEPHQRPPRRAERRGGGKWPPRPCYQCLRVRRDAAATAGRGWGGAGGGARGGGCTRTGGSARGGGCTRSGRSARDGARGAPHGGCSAAKGIGGGSRARGSDPRPGREGREGGGGEEGPRRLAGHGAARAWGRCSGGWVVGGGG